MFSLKKVKFIIFKEHPLCFHIMCTPGIEVVYGFIILNVHNETNMQGLLIV